MLRHNNRETTKSACIIGRRRRKKVRPSSARFLTLLRAADNNVLDTLNYNDSKRRSKAELGFMNIPGKVALTLIIKEKKTHATGLIRKKGETSAKKKVDDFTNPSDQVVLHAER